MATPASNSTQQNQTVSNATDLLPSDISLKQASKIAIEQDRAIMLDYYRDSTVDKAFIGEDPESKQRVLVKSKEEFTSLVNKIYKVGDEFIILTENSLYIVSAKIQRRKVNLASLQESYE